MKVITILPGEAPRTNELANTLQSLQEFVGGHIQAVTIEPLGELLAICHEEGKLIGLEPTAAVPWLHDILCGPVIVCRHCGGEFTPVRESDLPLVRWLLNTDVIQRRGRA